MSLGMSADRPFTALVSWGRVTKHHPDGWLFRIPGFDPEPCPEGAWELGPTLEVIPQVAEILAREAQLPVVMVEHPGNPKMVYVYTIRGGGHWQKKITVLTGGLGATTAVKTLLEAQAA